MFFEIVLILLLMLLVLIFIKNINTFNKRADIIKAIGKYRTNTLKQNQYAVVDYSDMESYEHTLFNIFEWGYEGILSKEKYLLVKPYMKL